LVSGKFSTNLYLKGTCFAEIMAWNEWQFKKWDVNFLLVFSLSMEAVCQAFRDHDVSKSKFDNQQQI